MPAYRDQCVDPDENDARMEAYAFPSETLDEIARHLREERRVDEPDPA